MQTINNLTPTVELANIRRSPLAPQFAGAPRTPLERSANGSASVRRRAAPASCLVAARGAHKLAPQAHSNAARGAPKRPRCSALENAPDTRLPLGCSRALTCVGDARRTRKWKRKRKRRQHSSCQPESLWRRQILELPLHSTRVTRWPGRGSSDALALAEAPTIINRRLSLDVCVSLGPKQLICFHVKRIHRRSSRARFRPLLCFSLCGLGPKVWASKLRLID